MARDLPLKEWLLQRADVDPLMNHQPHSMQSLVRDAVEALSAHDRYILEAKFYERLSYRELAVRIGKRSKGAAYYSVRSALHKLEKELEERGVRYDNY